MFNVGDRVISEYFGEGTVITIDNLDDYYPITVQFEINSNTIGYFTKEGYWNCQRLEEDMIKLIQIDNKIKGEENNMNHKLSDLTTNNRKFKIKYMDIQQYINKDELRYVEPRVIIGTIENFNPNAEVVIHGEDGQFCIIQYRQILQMEEIID